MILMYHKVDLTAPTIWWVTVNSFYQQMMDLQAYEVVSLDSYDPKNTRHVAITFDGIYRNVLNYAAPILKRFNYPFELFLTSDYLGKDNEFDSVEPRCEFTNEEELKRLTSFGGRLQWHTRSHPNLENETDPSKISRELDVPENLRQMDPDGFTWFAYPYGCFNDTVVKETRSRFKGAVSCIQGSDTDLFTLNRVTVTDDWRARKHSISVIIPSYNYGGYLVEAVDSVLRQTRPADQIIIADDASTDNTSEIARAYCARYPELISCYTNKENMGIVANFNKAASLAVGDYLCFLGADNRLVSNYIEETTKILDRDESVAVAYTDYALFGPRAKLEYDAFPETFKGRICENRFFTINFPQFNSETSAAMEERNFVHGSSMYRKEVFTAVGGYLSKADRPEDFDLFLRIKHAGWGFSKAVGTLLEYRQHSIDQANQRYHSLATIQFLQEELRRRDGGMGEGPGGAPPARVSNAIRSIISRQRELKAARGQTTEHAQDVVAPEIDGSLLPNERFLASCLVCNDSLSLIGLGSCEMTGGGHMRLPLVAGAARKVAWHSSALAVLELYLVISRANLKARRHIFVALDGHVAKGTKRLMNQVFAVDPGEETSLVTLDIEPQELDGCSGLDLIVTSPDGDATNHICVLR